MEGRESTSKTMALIDRADLPLRAGEWWVLRIVALVVGIAGGLVLLRGGVAHDRLRARRRACVLGWFLPAFVLRFLAKRRAKKFDTQLPDVLTLVASSLSTGLLAAAGPRRRGQGRRRARRPRSSAEPWPRRASAPTSARPSSTWPPAWRATTCAGPRWRSASSARSVATWPRRCARPPRRCASARSWLATSRALSAEGRLSAYILIGLPIGIFFYTMKTNRAYVELLWTRALGLAMLGGGIISLGIGWAGCAKSWM